MRRYEYSIPIASTFSAASASDAEGPRLGFAEEVDEDEAGLEREESGWCGTREVKDGVMADALGSSTSFPSARFYVNTSQSDIANHEANQRVTNLNQAMNVSIPRVVPHPLGLQLKRVQVCCRRIMSVRMGFTVSSASNVSTDQTYPEVRCRFARKAFRN